MIDIKLPPSPFKEGDLVKVKEASDVSLRFYGKRTPPGPIVAITETGAHVVALPDGRSLPYGPYDLEMADA